jgi:ribosomal protein L40E
MVKFPEAQARRFKNIFVCRKCKTKIRSESMKVIAGEIKCRKCKAKVLRPIKKK